MTDNPLAVVQREKKGAETFGDYSFQYHWALCRMLDEHVKDGAEYVIFVELHEDVVMSNSLEGDKAQFEFNQIKNVESKPYTVYNLTKQESETKNSVLGKLFSSYHGKPFKDRITTINLVASCGFSDVTKDKLDLEVITTGDMSDDAIKSFEESLKKEISLDKLPQNLRLIVPNLPSTGTQEHVIGRVSKLISTLYSGSMCDAPSIYRLLMDELHLKGQVTHDYKSWDDVVLKKGVTCHTVDNAIQEYTTIKGIDEVRNGFDDIARDLGLEFRVRERLKRLVINYHLEQIAKPSTLHLRLSSEVQKIYFSSTNDNATAIVKEIEDSLDGSIKSSFENEMNLKAAILHQLITGEP